MYDADAGANNLLGKTNAQVADFYSELFRRKQKEAVQLGLGGPRKVDSQVFAVALASYITNQTLAGNVAVAYGFSATEYGVGVATVNIGSNGAAFNVSNNSTNGNLFRGR